MLRIDIDNLDSHRKKLVLFFLGGFSGGAYNDIFIFLDEISTFYGTFVDDSGYSSLELTGSSNFFFIVLPNLSQAWSTVS